MSAAATHHLRPHRQRKVHRPFLTTLLSVLYEDTFTENLLTSSISHSISTLAPGLMTEGIIPEHNITDGSLVTYSHNGIQIQYVMDCTSERNPKIPGLIHLRNPKIRRINTLKTLHHYKNDNTKIVYVDETWLTTRTCHSRKWVDTKQPVTNSTYSRQLPLGEGERFLLIAGRTVDGFVLGSYCATQENLPR